MMFLHDLNLEAGEDNEILPEILQEDTPSILQELGIGKPRRHGPKAVGHPPSVEYPFGTSPTWNQVKHVLKNNPLQLIRAWETPGTFNHISTTAGTLFVKFTKDFWLSLKSECVEELFENEVENIDQAVLEWTGFNIHSRLKQPVFFINRSGIRGAVPGGTEAKSFQQRCKIFFPDPGITPPRGSKWSPFLLPTVGYIQLYHERMRRMNDDEREALESSLEGLFSVLQCLPDSEPYSATKEGKTWTRVPGGEGVVILTNAKHLRFVQIGRVRQVKTVSKRQHITKANKEMIKELYRKEGIVDYTLQRRERKKCLKVKSNRTKNKRKPPARRMIPDDSSSSESSSSESSSSTSQFM